MPIISTGRETFENASEEELEELSVRDQVFGFLVVNDERAFEAREIASHIGVDEGAVSTALSRLKHRTLVEHEATNWAVNERTRSRTG